MMKRKIGELIQLPETCGRGGAGWLFFPVNMRMSKMCIRDRGGADQIVPGPRSQVSGYVQFMGEPDASVHVQNGRLAQEPEFRNPPGCLLYTLDVYKRQSRKMPSSEP